ncbi:hypothetical protein E6P09_14220 [Haloferax mediterranei ATCC 33500]|uniref:Uncharacterized protein n=1 Tax=Haloferax mediterranei (strain ATCC 33500 / DSM 1411 / JCM 8866 / NBRC 14739 / NCIMB 2177 / R-4) TaxID=523841 RepID=I3R7H8_HALMT|nr:hypothetical protein [Haloferax mediterranei]AFK20188.1 hypothetical protein HFX_2506 [Haloferax mediterranei ATCC 33500]AHZ23564.1 hypothetical protein BM92_13355 [Haloferax mediterranei ATCC 33500]ELZ99048.1 hypothetical protein C439_14354 [Haloferax mediterranei ATCC 33500]MDX5987055.1 hypothetical protein [Haloferax mediterranei ATCC 33500]QCQ76372.1 hypothetical protein E6P09_14220 [Haloferax mediterranei ATCC 33500]
MSALLENIPFGLLPGLVMLAVVFAFGVAVHRWRAIRRGEESEPPQDRSEDSRGYPLASWRYVYDLDKAAADREVASVHEQAETLADVEQKRRK